MHAGADALAQLVLGNDGEDGAVVVQALIAGELGGKIVQAEIKAGPRGLIGAAGGAARSRCSFIRVWNAGSSTVMPSSAAISFVRSSGKP